MGVADQPADRKQQPKKVGGRDITGIDKNIVGTDFRDLVAHLDVLSSHEIQLVIVCISPAALLVCRQLQPRLPRVGLRRGHEAKAWLRNSGWKAACRDCGRPGGSSAGPLPQGHPQKHKTLQRLPFEGRGCGRKKK